MPAFYLLFLFALGAGYIVYVANNE